MNQGVCFLDGLASQAARDRLGDDAARGDVSRRNAAAIKRGQVDLRLGSAERLPAFDESFDKALAVNAMAPHSPVTWLQELRRVLRPGGRVAIAFQPRGPGATDEAAARRGQEIADALGRAGFSDVTVETLNLAPAVICATGSNRPDGEADSITGRVGA